ncbi:FtsX-like permease family protein [uncultured Solobacterium sp.]|uniref:FtsX-like permease family protein n=1 Tax=uncultured Solobacterium sp. TaxID=747375 RepID=UPI0028D16203|nr:FtsX-like permease family protein [uncultured Solobacterium sp.]
MAKKVFHKNVFRLIKSTKGRFFSLSAIVSIGVAFFIGVSASAPMMAASVDYYDDSYDLKDFTIYSNYGFREDDIEALKKVDSISTVEPGYFVDEIATSGQGTQLVRIHSYDSTHTINRFKLVEGRMPQNDHEVVAERSGNIKSGFEVGDTVKLSLPDGSRSGVLPVQEVTVVGVIDTPLYLNMSKETSTLDNLPINSYLYIPSSAFDSSNYLELNILTEDGKKLSSFSDSYDTYIAEVKQKIEALASTQQTETAHKIKEDAMSEYNDGMQKYIDGTKQYQDALDSYQKEIADAQQKLSESRADVATGEVEIANAKDKLVSAQNALNTEKLNRQAELDHQQEIINLNRATLESSQQTLNDQKSTLEQNKHDLTIALTAIPDAITLYQTEIQFRQGIAQYGISPTTPVSLLTMFRADLRQLCDAMFPEGYAGKTIGDLQSALDDHLQQIDQNFSLTASTKEDRLVELQNLQTQYTNDLATVQNALTVTIPASQQQITDGLAAVDQGQQQLNQGQSTLNQKIADGQAEIDTGWQAVYTNENKLADARVQIADGEAQLNSAITEGTKKLNDALEELNLSKAKLADAKKKIDDLAEGKWTILDRKSHYASVTFKNTVQQMEAISRVFPAFFILVAALVCLTTMTRLVEEQRNEIGTLRALGYTKWQCTLKYLFYAISATLIGIVVGSILGLSSFPLIIYHAWRMMYILPPIRFVVPSGLISLTAMVFIFAMSIATWFACKADTQDVPSQLMRPKAPPMGKKTFLENIPLIWNHLSFTDKVTMRNIFRYKKRFFMTIVGVAGCTALMLIGFGIRDSILNMVDINFKEIIQYDGMVSFEDDASNQRKEDALKEIQSIENVTDAKLGFVYTTKTYDDKVDETASVHVFDPKEINHVFNLRTRIGHKSISLTDDGVIINEKLAENLGVQIGGQITIEDEDGNPHQVKVSGITEMYINHFVIMSRQYYKEVFGKDAGSNIIYLSTTGDDAAQKLLANDISTMQGVEGVSLYSGQLDNFNSMVKGLNGIIWVLIISSMLLAFVVLSNLITVNISERQREIATLKVLGFRRDEVKKYIFKENNLLAGIGGIVGIPVGIALHRYIMRTVEMDYLMFGRNIEWISFFYALVLTILFSVIVNRMMTKRLNDIRMVESLKSVE